MPFAELVDIEKEIQRLKAEEKRLEGELKRSHANAWNEKFVSKAPQPRSMKRRQNWRNIPR